MLRLTRKMPPAATDGKSYSDKYSIMDFLNASSDAAVSSLNFSRLRLSTGASCAALLQTLTDLRCLTICERFLSRASKSFTDITFLPDNSIRREKNPQERREKDGFR